MVLTSRSTTGTNSRTDPTSTPSSGGWTPTGLAAAFSFPKSEQVSCPMGSSLGGAHRLAHESPCRPGPPTRRVRTPDEGTVPTAHRLACESRFRPGPPTRRVRTPDEGTVPTAHRLAHESPCRPGPPTRRVRTPGEGTVPTAHRLAHESPCRPGPPTRCPPHFPCGPAFQEGTETADRPVRVSGLYGRPFGLHPGVPPQTPPHLSTSEVGRFLRKRRCNTDRPDILLLLNQRPRHGDRCWPGSSVDGDRPSPASQSSP